MRRAGFCKFPRHPLGKDVREVARTESCELWLQSLELRWLEPKIISAIGSSTNKGATIRSSRGVASNHLANISKNDKTVSLKVEKNRPHPFRARLDHPYPTSWPHPR